MSAKKTAKKNISAFLAEEAEAIDADRDAAITDSTTVTRGHGRSKTLQIRLNPEELEELERIAATRGLPTSTVAREAVLRLINPTESRSAARQHLVDEIVRYVDVVATQTSHTQRSPDYADVLAWRRQNPDADVEFAHPVEQDPAAVGEFAKLVSLTRKINWDLEEMAKRWFGSRAKSSGTEVEPTF